MAKSSSWSVVALPEEDSPFHKVSSEKGTLAMNETDDFLAHYGVKGMKWGVRRSESALARARNRRRDYLKSQADSLRRVSKGKGNQKDKAVAVNTVSILDVAAGRGVKGGAANRAKKFETKVAKMDAKAARKSEKTSRGRAAAKKSSGNKTKVREIDTLSDAEAMAMVKEWIEKQNL